jgi:DNA-binding CsgD family transcriptional regulator
MARRNTRRRTTSGGGDHIVGDVVVHPLTVKSIAPSAGCAVSEVADLGRIAMPALGAALEAIPSPAFVVREPGVVVLANERGRAMLLAEQERVTTLLRTFAPPPRGPARFTMEAAPDHQLMVVHDLEQDARARLGNVSRRWGLTPRQSAVMELVARGDSNRAVAARLGCSEKTVELHVSALLAKTRCASRSQLVASFWTDPG